MRNWVQMTSAKFCSNFLGLLNLRPSLVYICEETSQELKVGTRLAQTLWTKTVEFHMALFMTPVLQLNSLVIPHIMQRERESATDWLWCIVLCSTIWKHSPFCPVSLIKVFLEMKSEKQIKSPSFFWRRNKREKHTTRISWNEWQAGLENRSAKDSWEFFFLCL